MKRKRKQSKNIAFIDGQNLYLGTQQKKWRIDFGKFRKYLKDKYKIDEAYYFLGYISEQEQDLYSNLQKAGFIIVFKEHNLNLKGEKKGNVDTDIVFEIMKMLLDEKNLGKILLVSGDGDYKKLVDYLVKKGRFLKILFPNKEFASSLYNELSSRYFDDLKNAKAKIRYK